MPKSVAVLGRRRQSGVAVPRRRRHPVEVDDWWLDELTTAGPEHLDPSYVDGYDDKAQVDPTGDIEHLQSIGLSAESTVVDLGAGTGAFAFAAAEIGATVIAVDISPAMVETLRRRAVELGLVNVRVIEAGFLSYHHDGPPADFVHTRNALHQLPDFWKVIALRRISEILRPGGVLRLRDLVFDLEPDEIDGSIETWMAGAADDPTRGYTAAEFAEHVRTEHSTFTWLLEPMLTHTGFEIIDHDVRRSVYAAYTCRLAV